MKLLMNKQVIQKNMELSEQEQFRRPKFTNNA